MTLSPARTFRAALWRVSSADSIPNFKTGLAGDSLFHANGANNGRMRQRDRAFDGGAWSNRAVRGRRARMNRGTERSGKPWGSIEAHTFACCPPEHFSSAWRNVKTPDSMRRADAVGQHVLTAVTSLPSRPIEDVRAGSNPAALTTFAVSTPEGRGPNVWIGHVTPVALSPCERKTRSRYQARPDCNPSPSRSSRHSIVTFHPQVQQSIPIPTHKPGPAFISTG